MRAPFLSVVVPAFNEEARIGRTITEVIAEFDRLAVDGELLVVDDGSSDRTASIVQQAADGDGRIRLVRAAHAGKGATVRRGMLESGAEWRFLADADLSMPISELRRFLDAAARSGGDVVVGSREAAGARRVGEPWSRHFVGRVFNWMVKMFVLVEPVEVQLKSPVEEFKVAPAGAPVMLNVNVSAGMSSSSPVAVKATTPPELISTA